MKKILILFIFLNIFVSKAFCQHSIDVQKAQLNQDYWDSLLLFERMPKRTATHDAIIAAGKSAWALGLVKKANQFFDQALLSKELTLEQKSDLLVSRGLIEFQEDNYEVAILFAKKAIDLFEDEHAFRGRAWLLWAESLYNKGSFGGAEKMYRNALKEIDQESINEVNFLLARCLLKNGKEDEAQHHFTQIPLNNERAPEVIKHLAEITFNQEDYEQSKVWLEAGRKNFKNKFLDSWVDYALTVIALTQNNFAKAENIQKEALKVYPPSDYWLTLLNSEIEAKLWKKRNPETRG